MTSPHPIPPGRRRAEGHSRDARLSRGLSGTNLERAGIHRLADLGSWLDDDASLFPFASTFTTDPTLPQRTLLAPGRKASTFHTWSPI